MMNASAADKMRQAINFAQKAWTDASKQFDAGSASLELKAGRSIDLFGGAVTRQVAELAQDSRNLCDELYATCQTQIRILDETCRPLLDSNTDFSLVRDLWTLIKKLNKESEITNNFTASLNQHNLGDVATVQYYPSMECKMIESYWAAKYESHPGKEAYDAEQRAIEEQEKKERQQAASRRKKEEKSAYKDAIFTWESKVKWVEQQRKTALEKLGTTALELRKQQLKQNLDSSIDRQMQVKKQHMQSLKEAEAEFASLGAFSFFKKREKQKLIADLNSVIARVDQAMASAKAEYAAGIKKIEKEIAQAEKEVAKKYPFPRKPRQPLNMKYANPTPTQMIIYETQNDVIRTLERYGKLSFADLKEKCWSLSDLTFSRAEPWLKSLEAEGQIAITKQKNGKTYYRLAD